MKKGFTLLELLIVIAILAILSSAIVLVLNPAQLLAQARDSQRLSDLSAIHSAIALYLSTRPGPDLAGGDPIRATSTVARDGSRCPFVQLGGNCVTVSSTAVDGTGWVRVKLTETTGGAAIPSLPHDPANTQYYYYAYAATNTIYELNGRLESIKFRDKMRIDGGDMGDVPSDCTGDYIDDTCYYEVGTIPGLNL